MLKKILIVDDEPVILSCLSDALHNFCDFNGEVKTAGNGKEAIKEISRSFYDICFLDMNLPDFKGLDVMKAINVISPETSIVIMTADSITLKMKRAIDKCASMFINKPFDLFQVRAFIQKSLKEDEGHFINNMSYKGGHLL